MAGVSAVGSDTVDDNLNSLRQETTTLFYEGFESGHTSKFESVGTGPNTFPAVVEDSAVAEGDYMLRTRSGTGTTDPIDIPESGVIELSFSVGVISSPHYAEGATAGFSIGDEDIPLVNFFGDPDGNWVEGVNENDLGSFRMNTWTDFRLLLDKNGDTTRCVYTINGDKRGETEIRSDIFGSKVDLYLFATGDAVLWDEFRVEHQSGSVNGGNPNIGAGGGSIIRFLTNGVTAVIAVIVGLLYLLSGSGEDSSGTSDTTSQPSSSSSKSPRKGSSSNAASDDWDPDVSIDEYGEKER